MQFVFAVLIGAASALVGSWLWRWGLICIGHYVFPNAWHIYEADLTVGRTVQREQYPPMQRIFWRPLLEEITIRALPVGLWFGSHRNYAVIISAWIVLNALWIAGHIWDLKCHKCHLSCKQLPWWTAPTSVYLHLMTMLGYALAYTGAWIVGGLGMSPQWPVHMLLFAVIRGFLAATIAHGIHNTLILDKHRPGRIYRWLRGISAD